jgi:hypothetical protein
VEAKRIPDTAKVAHSAPTLITSSNNPMPEEPIFPMSQIWKMSAITRKKMEEMVNIAVFLIKFRMCNVATSEFVKM